jgi:hypothetical protein
MCSILRAACNMTDAGHVMRLKIREHGDFHWRCLALILPCGAFVRLLRLGDHSNTSRVDIVKYQILLFVSGRADL